jgi:hypothetical protein
MSNTGSSVDLVRARLDEENQGEEERQTTANKGWSNTGNNTHSELKAGLTQATIHTAS